MLKNFSHQNLQGRNFQGQNLAGADFSHANIRGANFTGTVLTGANFEHSLAGVPPMMNVLIQGVLLILAAISSFVAVMAVTVAGGFFTPEFVTANRWFPGIVFLILLGLFLGLLWRYGFKTALITMAVVAIFFSPLVIVKPWFVAGEWTFTGLWITVGMALWVGVLSFAGVSAWIVGERRTWTAVGLVAWVAGLGGVLFGSGTSLWAGLYSSQARGWVSFWGLFSYLGIEILAGYISWQAGLGNQRFSLLQNLAISWASVGGTSFYRADLTEANFTHALLKQTNFSQANLTRTCWFKSRQINLARLSQTLLENPTIRELLVSGEGQNQSYIGLNLKGVNLEGVNLTRADLRGANLNDSNFKKACLNGANLSEIQALNTDFSEAKMTGALVSHWHLNEKTQLQKIVCEYFYFSDPQPERYPLNRDLAPGEFSDLFQPALYPIVLDFYRGIDWKVFLYTFKKIQESYPGVQFQIQGIEKKGADILLIHLQADQAIFTAKFKAEFNEIYDSMMSAITDKYDVEPLGAYLQENTQLLLMIYQFANRGVPVE